MRPAFTLIELLVALVVLATGVLALASTAGLVAGHVGDGARLTSAAHAARSTLDSLATQPCAVLVSGVAYTSGLTLRWTVTRDSLVAHVELEVHALLRRRAHDRTYRGIIPCSAG
ncbi:MAG TPA: type II secretion system protein [Gemmatimonadaceae bacterium]|jgi:prepilin-type N-terminal cleavage/methylation domain-containing protein|nr:type II secretion system protein [Gemmatimonadaceae bacterium]